MNLNRGLIKQQAKQLMQNNVLKLFVIQIVVVFCMSAVSGALSGIVNIYNIINGSSIFSIFNDDYFNYDFDEDFNPDDDFNHFGYDFDNDFGEDFNNFGYDFDDDYGNDFYNFDSGDSAPYAPDQYYSNAFSALRSFMMLSGAMSMLVFAANIIQLLLAPLKISLSGYYVSFIRGKHPDVGDGINTIFRNTFKNNYGKKIALAFLRSLLCGLLSLLFIIPGIVYYYSTYFAFQIMCDNPEISPSKALETSKKMVKGNRTELFVLNLSFIPWQLLCIFVFPIIYVMPYVATTDALFYENFRVRALQQGRITEDDFLSDAQLRVKYANYYANQNGAAPNGNNYQQNGYQPYNQPNNQQNANPYYNAQPNGQYYPPQQNGYYNQPQPNYTQPQQPTQAEYYNPAPKAEEPIEQTETEQPESAETRDPWEINHED